MKFRKSILAILLILLAGLSTSAFVPKVAAEPSIKDPTDYDSYYQSWFGIRPKNVQGTRMQFDQKVENYGENYQASVGLSSRVFSYYGDIAGGTDDQVEIRTIVSANGRKGVSYGIEGPYDSTYAGGSGTILALGDEGIAEVSIPFDVYFYGVEGTSSGRYNKVWICSNGYLEFNSSTISPNPQFGGGTPNAIIAPFWRDLNPQAGGTISYYGSGGVEGYFIVMWDNVPNKANGTPQSFLARINSISIGKQSPIEFIYGSITPNDGINTRVGIENQNGGKYSQFTPSQLSANKAIKFSGQTAPYYLNSFEVQISDQGDNDASIAFDPDYIAGYNVEFQSRQNIQIIPTWAKDAMGKSSLLLGAGGLLTQNPLLGLGGFIVKGVLTGIETYETLVNAYENARASEIVNASRYQSNAHAKVFCREGLNAPGDASLAIVFRWRFYDANNDVKHNLTITGKANYSESIYGADTDSVSTSVELHMIPGVQLLESTFEDGSLGTWTASDSNPSSGIDTWGADNHRCYRGQYSAWCAKIGAGSSQQYDNYMSASLEYSMTPLVGYNKLYLYFKVWIDSQNDTLGKDIFYVEYDVPVYPDPVLGSYAGRISVSNPRSNTQYSDWLSMRFEIPLNAYNVRFRFNSDYSTVYEGVYVDDIYLMAIPVGSDFALTLDAMLTTGESYSTEARVDGQSWYGTPVNMAVENGTHTIEVTDKFDTIDARYVFNQWEDGSRSNPRTLNVQNDTTVIACYKVQPAGGGGSGCPFVYAWNGTRYVIDNNLLPTSPQNLGLDVKDYYKLENALVNDNGKYKLLISEFENEHSYFDQIRLMAVDHDRDTHVAVSPNGEVLTYRDPYSPVTAIDNYENNILPTLRTSDGQYYTGNKNDSITLNFGKLDTSKGAKLVLRTDAQKVSIHIQVLDSSGSWIDAASVSPRIYWATQIVDLSEYLRQTKDDIRIRLYFTATHKIDYVGLDTSRQASFQTRYSNLISAVHTWRGDVTEAAMKDDGVYAELFHGEHILLEFSLPENMREVRDFIVVVDGRYETITP